MRRMRFYLPVLALLTLIVGWCAAWFVIVSKAETKLDEFVAREAAAGRVIACPSRTIAGFPFRFELACERPSFAGRIGGAPGRIEAKALRAVAQIYQPNQILADLDGPLVYRNETTGEEASLAWRELRASLRGLPGAFERVSLAGSDVTLTARGGALLQAKGAEVHLRRNPQKQPSERLIDVAVKLDDAAVAPLDALMGATDPLRLDLLATISDSDALLRRGALAERLEAWRLASGVADLTEIRLAKGAIRIEGTAALSIDDQRRLAGQADLKAAGLEPILKRFGLPAGALNVGGALGNLLGRPKPASDAPQGPMLPLPLRFSDGRVSLGPVPTPLRLAPLY